MAKKKAVVTQDSYDATQESIRKAQDKSRGSVILKSAAEHKKALGTKK